MGEKYDHLAEMAKYLHFRPGQSAEEWINRHVKPAPSPSPEQFAQAVPTVDKIPLENVYSTPGYQEYAKAMAARCQSQIERQIFEKAYSNYPSPACGSGSSYAEPQPYAQTTSSTTAPPQSKYSDCWTESRKKWFQMEQDCPGQPDPVGGKFWYPDLSQPPYTDHKTPKYNRYTKPDGTAIMALVLEKPYY